MVARTAKRKFRRKGKGASAKRKPKGKNQRGGSSVRKKPKRKSQRGGFILTPFTKLIDNTMDYERRKQRAKKRGKKFKKEKTTDHVWGYIEEKLG